MKREDALTIGDGEFNNVTLKLRSKMKHRRGEFNGTQWETGGHLRKIWKDDLQQWAEDF